MNQPLGWWGTLTEDSKFREIWENGEVPLRHPFPFVPTADAPLCYLVDENRCTLEQVDALAEQIFVQWDECDSINEALAYIRHPGLPLATDHFTSIGTADSKMLNAFLGD